MASMLLPQNVIITSVPLTETTSAKPAMTSAGGVDASEVNAVISPSAAVGMASADICLVFLPECALIHAE